MAGPITIAILGDNRGLNRSLGQTEGRLGKLGGVARGAGKVIAGGLVVAGAAAVGFGVAAVKSASSAQQSIGATETVFGKFASRVVGDSKRAADEFGLSANEYRENANLIGSLFRNQGVQADELAGKTKDMIRTGSDLAATFGGKTKDAVAALGSAFKGEFDPLERYGISIKQSTINAELAARGQDKLTGSALKAAQQQATSRLIMEQSSRATGAFARESNTLEGQQQRLGASFENIKARVGGALLPALTAGAAFLNGTVLPAFERFIPPILDGARALGQRLRPSIVGVAGVLRTVVPIVLNMWRAVGTNLMPAARQLAKTFKADVLPSLRRVVPPVLRFIASVVKLASKILGTVLPPIIRLAGFILRNLVPAVVAIVGGATKAIGGLARFGSALVAGGKRVADFAGKVKTGISNAITFVTSLPGRIRDAVSGAATWLLDTGKAVITGFISGLRSMASSIVSAVKSYVIDKIPGPIRKALGISSPSKVTIKIARQTAEGLIVGFKQRGRAVERAAVELTAKVRKRMGELATEVRKSAISFGSIIQSGGDEPTGDSITQGLLERLEKVRAFRANIAELRGRLNKRALRELIDAGAEQGGAAAAALVAGGTETIKQVNQLQRQLVAEAGKLGKTSSRALYVPKRRQLTRQAPDIGVGDTRAQLSPAARAAAGRQRQLRIKLTAEQLTAIQRGRQIRLDLDEYEGAGGPKGGK